MLESIREFAKKHAEGQAVGITSVCSAHPLVLRAALRHGRETGAPVLIEATCNQVNHQGGYTGMQPTDFAALVYRIAEEEHCPKQQIILGGDHLGPNPWRHLPSEEAMQHAEQMMAAYVEAGFRKIHLDASMGCLGEPEALDDEITATRAARLAAVAEASAHATGGELPIYVIGTEVPPPGGADHAITELAPTTASAAANTIEVHRRVFTEAGLGDAFSRAVAIVVQPGVEFGNQNVIRYQRDKALGLIGLLKQQPQFVFEAHSTDYQGAAPLGQLVEDGFAILKVGPELSFVLREALYSLDLIASDLLADYGERALYQTMERMMLEHPQNWASHYSGTDAERKILRHYSYSDRIRYYWAMPEAELAVARLIEALNGRVIPIPLLRQYMPNLDMVEGKPFDANEVLVDAIMYTLRQYYAAC